MRAIRTSTRPYGGPTPRHTAIRSALSPLRSKRLDTAYRTRCGRGTSMENHVPRRLRGYLNFRGCLAGEPSRAHQSTITAEEQGSAPIGSHHVTCDVYRLVGVSIVAP